MKIVKSTKGKYIGPVKTPDPYPTGPGKRKKTKVKRRK